MEHLGSDERFGDAKRDVCSTSLKLELDVAGDAEGSKQQAFCKTRRQRLQLRSVKSSTRPLDSSVQPYCWPASAHATLHRKLGTLLAKSGP